MAFYNILRYLFIYYKIAEVNKNICGKKFHILIQIIVKCILGLSAIAYTMTIRSIRKYIVYAHIQIRTLIKLYCIDIFITCSRIRILYYNAHS